jgi:cell division protease FtsH
MALGYTLQLPEEDRFLISRNELIDRICVLLGGRVAEEITQGDITTGAQNDLERATQLARQMVTEFGMSEKLGPMTLGRKQHEVFLGRDIVDDRNYSDEVAFAIDQEMRAIIDDCHSKVKTLLSENFDLLHKVTRSLLEREILEGEDLETLIAGGELLPLINHEKEKAETASSEQSAIEGETGNNPSDDSGGFQPEPAV